MSAALEWFCERWSDEMLAFDLGPKITCVELEALAELLETEGHPEAAQLWRRAHGEGDDEGDMHNPDGSTREAVADREEE